MEGRGRMRGRKSMCVYKRVYIPVSEYKNIKYPYKTMFLSWPQNFASFDIPVQYAIIRESSKQPNLKNREDAKMGRPKGSKNKAQEIPTGTIGLGGPVAPITEIPAKPKGENTLGKLNREIVLRFPVGALTARNSGNENLACGGRAIDQNGIVWNVTTAMPLNPATGKSCPTASVNIPEFLNGVAPTE